VLETFQHWVNASCADTRDWYSCDDGGDTCLSEIAKYPSRTSCCDMEWPVQNSDLFDSCLRSFGDVAEEGVLLWANPGGELKAVRMEFRMDLRWDDPYEKLDTYYADMTNMLDNFKGNPGMSDAFFKSSLHFYDLQKSLGTGVYMSGGTSLAFAFVILLVTTRSIMGTFLSLFTLAAIVVCVIGVLVLAGWQLNIMESLIISVAVGVSVDFCAHYCHTYLQAPNRKNRAESVEYMLTVMGVSVLTGAITTCISGMFMLPAQTLFFYQFGLFLCVTMCFSWLYANFFLAPMLGIAGPVSKDHRCFKPGGG